MTLGERPGADNLQGLPLEEAAERFAALPRGVLLVNLRHVALGLAGRADVVGVVLALGQL